MTTAGRVLAVGLPDKSLGNGSVATSDPGLEAGLALSENVTGGAEAVWAPVHRGRYGMLWVNKK